MGYFARTAPLGPVGPAPVTASFYGFHPDRAARALPDAWTCSTPEQALEARAQGAAAALHRLWGHEVARSREVTEAAETAHRRPRVRRRPVHPPGPSRADPDPGGFDFTADPKLPAAATRDLAALRWVQPGQSVILYGPVSQRRAEHAALTRLLATVRDNPRRAVQGAGLQHQQRHPGGACRCRSRRSDPILDRSARCVGSTPGVVGRPLRAYFRPLSSAACASSPRTWPAAITAAPTPDALDQPRSAVNGCAGGEQRAPGRPGRLARPGRPPPAAHPGPWCGSATPTCQYAGTTVVVELGTENRVRSWIGPRVRGCRPGRDDQRGERVVPRRGFRPRRSGGR